MRNYHTRSTTDTVFYKGIAFHRYPNSRQPAHRNYYRPHAAHIRNGVGHLHQEVWKDAHGPIPEGHVIHHADGNPLNNAIGNLECITNSEHKRIHAERGDQSSAAIIANLERIRPLTKQWHASEAGRQWHRDHAHKVAADRRPEPLVCEQCGKAYEAIFTGANRFCSKLCSWRNREQSGRRKKPKDCPFCGQTFPGRARQKHCSRVCAGRARATRDAARLQLNG